MWLHLPSSASAPAAEASTPDYDSLCPRLAASATWREKSLKPESWRRALRRAGWTKRLSGLTCTASTAERGVASWMASLAASRASLTPTRASGSARMTSETSGLSLPDWYSTLRQRSASLRTFQASLLTTTEPYDPTYKPWVMRLKRESSRRRRLARHISASASSSWPTPDRAPEAPNTGSNRTETISGLGNAAQVWAGGTTAGATRGQLRQQAMWSTATAHDGRRPGDDSTEYANRNLKREAESWAGDQAPAGGGLNWATPRAAEYKGTGEVGSTSHAYRLEKHYLDAQTLSFSLPGPETETDGAPSSRRGRVLNPRFVEALMGWPGGVTDFESSATEWYPWQQRMRSSLSALGW